MGKKVEGSILWTRVKTECYQFLLVTSSFLKCFLKVDEPETVLVPRGNMTWRKKNLYYSEVVLVEEASK